jgi:DNA phosphorothioation-associated putative methyltransferase
MQVARHKTAISRPGLSRPIRVALADGVLSSDKSVFDYGCGIGGDLRRLRAHGFQAEGWDPVHSPKESLRPSSVVNLGYVVNVIESPTERVDTLRKAWDLALDVLIVSARLSGEGRFLSDAGDFADGCLTGRRTFQKFFDQHELRNWIDQTLHASSVPAAPGIFYVFRTEEARSAFLASRWRRRIAAPRLARSPNSISSMSSFCSP